MANEKCNSCKLRYVCEEQAEFICKQRNYCDYMPDSKILQGTNKKRLIDAYALAEQVHDSKNHNPHTDIKVARNHRLEHEHFLKMVCLAPTVDAVEVVPCIECRYYNTERAECKIKFDSDGENLLMPPDAYCSDGKRRKNDG